jgi:hypothetical protein
MPRKHKCQRCGLDHSTKVRYVEDPYARQVDGVREMWWLCDPYGRERSDDA